MPQYLISPEDITGKNFKITNSSELWHLTKVLRIKPGETINIFDGIDKHYLGEVTKIDIIEVQGKIIKEIIYKKRDYTVRLFPSLINMERFEMMLEKATEVGVDIISPILTERTMARIDAPKVNAKMERWKKIIVSAVKQCDCEKIPQLGDIAEFPQAVSSIEPASLNLIAYEAEPIENLLKKTLNSVERGSVKTVNLFLGPEGGFTEKEIILAKGAGLKTFSLGQNILRAETAAISCLSIIHSELYSGDTILNRVVK
ncbi:MAG: hypothetical protein A2297_03740 [Elusimicrobia bacterium RIFOXYB2_FULL_48_7]|nr:MAG: hypothetical protein A2297_03740 [Elusimicrobia bacterium RIFOXYB2_FULL_48_7]